MTKFLIILFLIPFFNSVNAQYNWENISYTHSASSNADNSRTYYIINIDKNGNGKLEYFSDGKVDTKEYKISRKNLNFLNSKIKQSGIYKVNPKDLAADTPQSTDYVYTMTLTLDEEFGKNYEYKFDRSKLEGHEKRKKDNEEDEGEKLQVIPVPNNLKPEYKKNFYNLYHDIELIVPNYVWREIGVYN
jgi:hypothetical protein